jgi:hypothetical protein
MPRKPRRARLRTVGLTPHQREILLFGVDDVFKPAALVDLSPLNDADLARLVAETERRDFPEGAAATWRRYRDELIHHESLSPGQRPAAFWRFDVGVTPPCHWWAELDLLMRHNLLTPEEAIAIERDHASLSPNPPAGSGGACRGALSPAGLGHIGAEFNLAAAWHLWRGRPELAEVYRLRAQAVRVEVRRGRG